MGQRVFDGVNQVKGTSMAVGTKIFSIARGLGSSGDQIHVFELSQLVVRGRHLLRKQKMLAR